MLSFSSKKMPTKIGSKHNVGCMTGVWMATAGIDSIESFLTQFIENFMFKVLYYDPVMYFRKLNIR